MNKKLIRKMLTAAGGPINYKRWDNAKITSYTIPFIKEKAIKLTNAGRATGAVLSTNLLDSLADNAMRAGVPVRTAIGISTKETTLGNPTDTKSAWNLSSGIRREFNGKYPGTHLHINPGRGLNERELVINYHKGHLSDTDTLGKSVILEALEFYKQHPDNYNTNQSDYQNLVNIIGEEVMKSPEVLKWYREWERSKAQIFRPEPYKINTNIQNTALEFMSLKKQGGKMNILEFLKNGSGIHIKEKNKGSFTRWCGGNVTEECIRRGKNSSNPKIRKKATFADNARHFKHKKGGAIKALEGTKFNWGSAIGNLASTALLLGISTYMLNKKLSSDAEVDKEKYKSEAASKLQKDMQDERTKRFNILNAIKGTSDNPNAFGGGIFENYFINLGDNEAIRNYNQSISDYNKMIDLQIRAQKAENTGNFLSSLGLLGVGLLANSAFNKNSTNTSSASTSATSSTNTSYNLSNFWSTPSLSNYLSNLSVSTQS